MTTKNEGSGNDTSRTGEQPGSKRPHATIDLKATEVKTEPKSATVTTTSASAGAATSAAAGSQAKSPGDQAKDAPKDPSKSAPASSANPSSTSKTDGAPSSAKPAAAPKAEAVTPSLRKPSLLGRIIGHLASGLAGGAAALYMLHWLPEGNILKPFSPVAEKVRLLETKLNTLEEATSTTEPDPDVVKKFDEATARIKKLEAAVTDAANLPLLVAKLESDTKSLADKVAQNPAGEPGAAERLAKLEDKLNLLAAAAGTGSEKGGVPQLAAITGRIADLENNLAVQVANLRKSIPEEVGTRLSQVAEASEAARSGTQRIDRELQGQKTDSARITQRLETLKADADRLTASLEALKQEQGRQSSNLEALKSSLDGQIKSLAKPADISTAVNPIAGKVEAIEKNLETVVKSEEGRRADAERIVISLELANLKRALDRGKDFSAELAQVRKVAGDKINLSALDRYQSDGVPTISDLEQTFRQNINRVLDAESEPENASFIDRIVSGAKSVVRVRRVNHDSSDKSTEALIARAESALKDGQLGDALTEIKAIPSKAGAQLADWVSKAEARHSVDRAIAAVEAELKSSLGATDTGPAVSTPPAAQPKQDQ